LKLIRTIDSVAVGVKADKLYTSYKPYDDNNIKFKKFDDLDAKPKKEEDPNNFDNNFKLKKFEELDVKSKKEEESNNDLLRYNNDSNYKIDTDYNYKSVDKYKDGEFSTKFFDKYKKEETSGNIPSESIYEKKKVDASPNKFIGTTNSSIEGSNYITITENMNPEKKDKPNYSIGSPSVSFNYTDRLKDEFNQQRQRFASEKRTYTRPESKDQQQPSINYDTKYSTDKIKVGEIKRDYNRNAEGIKRPVVGPSNVLLV
jgi:hypothetical protein